MSTSLSRCCPGFGAYALSLILLLSACCFFSTPKAAADPGRTASADKEITVASYYFGNYHPGDPRNTRLKGPNWSEWDLVKQARPRFPGHEQPKTPLWGYLDESDPQVMSQKITAAASHGIDVFIFDWYYYDDGPFLEGSLDDGFLKARNNKDLGFAIMWANHDWADIHPSKGRRAPQVLMPGKVTPETFQRLGRHLIDSYFTRQNYWRIDGKPYFSIYDVTELLASFGSVRATRAGLDQLRAQAKAAGLPDLHLNLVWFGQPKLPSGSAVHDAKTLISDLGIDSVTSYVWIHHVQLSAPQTDYVAVRDGYFSYWDRAVQSFNVPYIPNVTMGWDPTPRYDPADLDGPSNFYGPIATISGNTPARFREALLKSKNKLLREPKSLPIVNINCWNEWTEGSYLEPEAAHGMAYLEAVRAVFPNAHPQAE